MTDTAINTIPYVPEDTTDPAAGLNLSIDAIDALLQPTVLAIQDAPPGGPSDGDRYIVGTGSGAWASQDDKMAVYRATGTYWDFYDAKVVYNLSNELWYINDGGWAPLASHHGRLSIEFTSDANLTLSTTLGSEQWPFKFLTFTDATGPDLTAGRDVIFPALDGPVYLVNNQTAQTLTMKISGQTGVPVATATKALIYYNGTDMEATP